MHYGWRNLAIAGIVPQNRILLRLVDDGIRRVNMAAHEFRKTYPIVVATRNLLDEDKLRFHGGKGCCCLEYDHQILDKRNNIEQKTRIWRDTKK